MTHTQRVDASVVTAVAICTCGWRSLQGCRAQAWTASHTHAVNMHPGDDAGDAQRRAAYWA